MYGFKFDVILIFLGENLNLITALYGYKVTTMLSFAITSYELAKS